jgi:UDP-N-acetylmuramoylalanine--D-glutamate ligase
VIPVTTFTGKKVAVFGLGGSGLASASALLAGGADVVAFDDDAASVAKANAAGIPTADLQRADWSKIAALVLAPGVPLTHPEPHWVVALAQKAAVEVIGDIELFCRERARQAPDAPFVAITGTNGKSTTTALIAHLAASAGMDAQLGGNIGTAILSLLPPRPSRFQPLRVHVIECSSYQIDLSPSLDPSIGILINLTADHLDRHGTMENYAAVKERLVAGVPRAGTAIVGVDDEWCQKVAVRLAQSGKHVVRISVRRALSNGLFVEGGRIMRASGAAASAVAELGGIGSLRGLHNAQNAACAAAAALALGLEPMAIQAGLRSFPGLPHRMEEVGRRGAILFVNDSKATNADSAAQALACFSDIFWIAGGKPKTGGIESLRNFFPRILKAYLIGEAADEFAATLGRDVPHEITGTLDKALWAAARDAEASGAREPVVLLSPACASFDQYRNFEVRGDAFRDRVRALPGVTPKA